MHMKYSIFSSQSLSPCLYLSLSLSLSLSLFLPINELDLHLFIQFHIGRTTPNIVQSSCKYGQTMLYDKYSGIVCLSTCMVCYTCATAAIDSRPAISFHQIDFSCTDHCRSYHITKGLISKTALYIALLLLTACH